MFGSACIKVGHPYYEKTEDRAPVVGRRLFRDLRRRSRSHGSGESRRVRRQVRRNRLLNILLPHEERNEFRMSIRFPLLLLRAR
jgi:hypothetical protein